MKKIILLLIVLSVFIGCGKGKEGNNSNNTVVKSGSKITVAQYKAYIQKMLAYFESPEYTKMSADYKKAVEGIKKIMERQKVWNKYMKPTSIKTLSILKSCNLTTKQLIDGRKEMLKDKETSALFWKMTKYIVH